MQVLLRTKLERTPVYDIYWRFACERQNVFFNRLAGKPPPWTSDPIVRKYKFTNAYRALDRVSQFLIAEIINRDKKAGLPKEDKVFRILLFKLFNKVETWQLLEDAVGAITSSRYSFRNYDDALSDAFHSGRKIYSAAYIMASGESAFGLKRKHQNHLKLLEQMMATDIGKRVASCCLMAELYAVLLSYPLIGTFLAYQFATDINYSDITDFSEEEFVMPGPGAQDGIAKCFYDKGGLSDADVIRHMMDSQENEFTRLGLKFRTLFGRSLKLIDCQNLFCEVGKYARVSHPRISDRSGRARIKQVYRTTGMLPVPYFPEKWGLTDAVHRYISAACPADEAVSDEGRQ